MKVYVVYSWNGEEYTVQCVCGSLATAQRKANEDHLHGQEGEPLEWHEISGGWSSLGRTASEDDYSIVTYEVQP